MSFSPINKILDKNFKSKPGLAQQITAALVCDEFDKIIQQRWGNRIKNKAKALYFKDNIITLACLSSVMAQEIKLHEQEILGEVNQKFNQAVIRIRYLI